MKKAIIIIAIVSLLPLSALAHQSQLDLGKIANWPGMVHYVEDMMVDGDVHRDMELLMNKMMTQKLTEAEAKELARLSEENPSVVPMMMQRIVYEHGDLLRRANSPRPGGISSLWNPIPGWLVFLGVLIWVVVGLMLVVHLAQKGNKKNK